MVSSREFLYQLLTFFPVFLFALTVHELFHALTASWAIGNASPYRDRLTLNPLAHIDPIGTVLLPILMIALPGGFLFGWAKPVPFDRSALRRPIWHVIIALAGPFANFLLAVAGTLIFSLLLRIGIVGHHNGWWTLSAGLVGTYNGFVEKYVLINWLLLVFNMMPVPPLDGSHVLYYCVFRSRPHLAGFWEAYSRFGFIIFIILLWTKFFGLILAVPVWIGTRLTLDLLAYPSQFFP